MSGTGLNWDDQDIYEDLLKGRVYIPSTEMNKFTLKESDIKIKTLITIGKCLKFHG